MVIYYLITFLVILIIINYIITNGDIVSPQNIVTLGFLGASLFCTYLIDYYEVQLSWKTFLIIFLGLTFFSIGSTLVVLKSKKAFYMKEYYENFIEYRPTTISNVILITFCAITTVLFVFNVIKVAGGFNALEEVTYVYRAKGYDGSNLQPFYVNQMIKLFKAIAYVYLFYFINNIVYTKKIKKNILLLFPTIFLIVVSIFGASRTELITILCYVMVLVFFFNGRKKKYSRKASIRFAKYAVVAVSAFLILFSSMRTMVGRKSTSDPMTYIASYVGGSIELLDIYIQDEGLESKAEMFGEETFYALRSNLGISSKETGHQEFRRAKSGILVGNVYTSLRKYLHDFGVFGVVFIQTILGFFYTYWYKKTEKRLSINPSDHRIMFFAYFYVPIIKSFVQEETLSMYLCLNSLLTVILLYLVYYFTYKKRIVLRI